MTFWWIPTRAAWFVTAFGYPLLYFLFVGLLYYREIHPDFFTYGVSSLVMDLIDGPVRAQASCYEFYSEFKSLIYLHRLFQVVVLEVQLFALSF